MPTDQLFPVVLGFVLGLAFALAIFVSDLAVRRLIHVGSLLDVALRLAVFAAIVFGASHLIGSFFGPLVRAHALGFWCSCVVGFIAPPWLAHFYFGRAERNNAG
ncbi:hypothetical protein GCM10007320_10630 [Pseudorhodoferax aquiterrae]|uniref:Uncharacterized protein n=1 Tax=Pseudorhodoferax aquiterrae TaxID=747304 RepID=A0ABQ3FX92_9BURK|nr:hypothetical protein [Pseudorhodoferax aquiterrae]GHC73735.1 hypothetical protein GCM10007320_10630 [Pseudorhodoferax aquiterrae]